MEQIEQPRIRSTGKGLTKFGVVIITLLAVVYVVNFFTPLRLTNDTVRYLTIKESIQGNKPVNDYLPYGYVFFLLILDKLHLLHAITVPLLQFLYLLGALYFVKRIFPNTKTLILLAAMLLQWTTMKYVITFLSEMQFMFFSIGTIYFFQRYRSNRTMSALLSMLVFLIISILTRTVGVVLIPALIGSVLLQPSLSLKQTLYRYKWPILFFIGFVMIVLVFQKTLRVSAYFGLLPQNEMLRVLKNDFINHLADWAAIFLNFSYSKFPAASASLVTILYFAIGLLFFIAVAYLIAKSAKQIATPVKLYLLFYCIIIFLWPFFDPRFWVPIVPLLIAILIQAMEMIPKRIHFIVTLYCIYYAIAGLGALGFYTYTSMNKTALSAKQDASIWQNEYEQYFFGKPITHPDAKVREKIIHILERYD